MVLCTFLVACSGSDEEACSQDYEGEYLKACLPKNWVVVERDVLEKRGIPEDAVVAFQSELPSAGQFPSIIVTREPLADDLDAEAYSDASIRSVGIFSAYQQVDVQETSIDDEDVKLHIFTAQPVPDEPVRRFYQESTVVDGYGYTITGTTPVTSDDVLEGEILTILHSISFDIEEEEEKKKE